MRGLSISLLALLLCSLPAAAVAAAPPAAGASGAAGDRLAWFDSIPRPTSPDPLFSGAWVVNGGDEGFGWIGDPGSYCLGDDYWSDAGDGVATDLVLLTSFGACDDDPGMVVLGSWGHQVDRSVEFYEIGVDLDLDAATGCDGWDGFVLGSPTRPPFWVTSADCDTDTWVVGDDIGRPDVELGLRRGGHPSGWQGGGFSVHVPQMTGTVRWYAGILGEDDTYDSAGPFLTPSEVITCNSTASDPTSRDGYWLATLNGEIHSLGSAPELGQICDPPGARSIVDLAVLEEEGRTGWAALHADGLIRYPRGRWGMWTETSAPVPWALGAGRAVALLNGSSDVPNGPQLPGYDGPPCAPVWWVVYDNGAVAPAGGSHPLYGDLRDVELNAPIIDAQLTPSGNGYWLIGADGGVFSFGDAEFFGSTGSLTLNEPVVGMAPDPDGEGYWLVASDGGVFAFDAPFVGSIPGELAPGTRLNRPIIAMEPYGNGYVLLGTDGGVFNFSDRAFAGSLGADPPDYPVVAIQPIPQT